MFTTLPGDGGVGAVCRPGGQFVGGGVGSRYPHRRIAGLQHESAQDRIGAPGALRVAALSQAARHADRPGGAGKAHDHRRQRREPVKRVEISPRHEVDHGASATETHGQQQRRCDRSRGNLLWHHAAAVLSDRTTSGGRTAENYTARMGTRADADPCDPPRRTLRRGESASLRRFDRRQTEE